MMRDTIAHFPRQVEPPAFVFQDVDDPQALLVMVEASGHQIVEHALPRMPERCMPKVVSQSNRFSELLVKLENLCNRSRDLRHLERVGEARPVVIACWGKEDLRLVLQPAERLRVNDAVAVALKRRPYIVFGFFAQTSPRVGAFCGLRREDLSLTRFEVFTDTGHKSRSAGIGSVHL
jgi:hypothetical protein